MKRYLQFVVRERRLLSFGATFTFFSSFGQTFLISLFVPFFLSDFNLTNAEFGSIFAGATFTGALLLPYLGQWIDRLPLKKFSLMVAVSLMTAAFAVSVAWNPFALFAGLMLLRIAGQGLSLHTAQTTMARFYHNERGKALCVASLGYPIGEALLPLAIAAILPVLGWHLMWTGIAAVIGLILIPYIFGTLRGDMNDHTTPDPATAKSTSMSISIQEIFKDKHIFLMLPAVLIPSFWVTSLFLYQIPIAHSLGWSATLIATAFIGHAIARILSTIAGGELIDAIGPRRLFPYHLIPLGLGFLAAWFHTGIWSAFAYMFLMGITLGISKNLRTALWAEIYGTEVVGSVRSLFSSFTVICMAIGPLLMGWLIDNHIPISNILLTALITVVAASVLAYAGVHRKFLFR